jgi:hypothetical protein
VARFRPILKLAEASHLPRIAKAPPYAAQSLDGLVRVNEAQVSGGSLAAPVAHGRRRNLAFIEKKLNGGFAIKRLT